ncbi:MAG: DUF3800 domain-containing protein [Phycisphaerae bacterium]
MYLMYVDESGDCGLPADGSRTNLFCLAGLVVHELRWRDTLADLARFRHDLWKRYKINIEDELHAGDIRAKRGALTGPGGSYYPDNPRFRSTSIVRLQ